MFTCSGKLPYSSSTSRKVMMLNFLCVYHKIKFEGVLEKEKENAIYEAHVHSNFRDLDRDKLTICQHK